MLREKAQWNINNQSVRGPTPAGLHWVNRLTLIKKKRKGHPLRFFIKLFESLVRHLGQGQNHLDDAARVR